MPYRIFLVTTLLFLSALAAVAQDVWEWRSPTPTNKELQGITRAKDLYVAVGKEGSIITSPDGVDWTPRRSRTGNDLEGVSFINNRFYAVGHMNIVVSDDGLEWQPLPGHNIPTTFYSITSVGSRFVAAGWSGIFHSTDAVTWTQVVTNRLFRHIRPIDGVLYALGDSEAIFTSSDGIAWTERFLAGGSNSLRSLAFSGGRFVAAGTHYPVISEDGITWRRQVNTVYSTSIHYTNGRFIAIGYGKVHSSADGLTWEVISSAPQEFRTSVLADGMIVGVGASGVIATSTDGGSSWNKRSKGATKDLSSITYGNGRYVTLSWGSSQTLSTDGVEWEELPLVPEIAYAYGLVFGNGRFVISRSDAVAISEDGRDWQVTSLPSFSSLQFVHDRFFANFNNAYRSSPDGVNWTPLNLPQTPTIVHYCAGRFIAPVSSTTYLISSDGVTWTSHQQPGVETMNQIIDTGSVIVGINSTGISTSRDGISWTHRHPFSPVRLAYGGGQIVAVGGTTILRSGDGVDWTPVADPGHVVGSGDRYTGIIFQNNQFLICGTRGLIMASVPPIGSPAPKITSELHVTAKTGEPFRYDITATHLPLAFTAAPLPGRLSLHRSTGAITGVPTMPGVYQIQLGAANVSGQGAATLTLHVEPPDLNWRQQHVSGAEIRSVAFGAGVYVAVGRNETILASTDGLNWSRLASGEAFFNDVIYANGRFVAVGTASIGGLIMTSEDGVNWQHVQADGTHSLASITYGNGMFIAVGRAGHSGGIPGGVMSTDGINWTQIRRLQSGTGSPVGTIAFGAGRFVTHEGLNVHSSADGWSWQTDLQGHNIIGIAYGNGRFVAIATHGRVWISTNGTNWTQHQVMPSSTLTPRAIRFLNGEFIITGWNQLHVSEDGVNWKNHQAPAATTPLAYGDAGHVFGSGASLWQSSDALTTWQTGSTRVSTASFTDAVHAADRFVAVGTGGAMLTSEDGVHWTARTPVSANLNRVIHHAGRFIAAGAAGVVLTSTDGEQWTRRTIATTAEIRGLAASPSTVVAVLSDGRTAVSADGIAWSVSSETHAPSGFRDVAYCEGRFIAADLYVCLTSFDGITWSQLLSIPPSSAPHRFLVAQGKTFFRATDGVRRLEFGPPQQVLVLQRQSLQALSFADGHYYATNEWDIIKSSSATDWRRLDAGVPGVIRKMISANGVLLAVGDNGLIISSPLPNGSGPVVHEAAPPVIITGRVVHYRIAAEGHVTHYSATGLPPGLKLNPYTGIISGVPLAAGNYSIQVTAHNASGSASRNLPMEVMTPYAHWKLTHFGSVAEQDNTADHDHDGRPMLLEYALGTDPHDGGNAGDWFHIVRWQDNDYAGLTFHRRKYDSSLSYQVLVSLDLNDWFGYVDEVVVHEIRDLGQGLERVTLRDRYPISERTGHFLRIQVLHSGN